MTGNIELDNDDQWLEDEIQQELDQLDDNCLLSDEEQCSHENSPENNISSADTKVLIDSCALRELFFVRIDPICFLAGCRKRCLNQC